MRKKTHIFSVFSNIWLTTGSRIRSMTCGFLFGALVSLGVSSSSWAVGFYGNCSGNGHDVPTPFGVEVGKVYWVVGKVEYLLSPTAQGETVPFLRMPNPWSEKPYYFPLMGDQVNFKVLENETVGLQVLVRSCSLRSERQMENVLVFDAVGVVSRGHYGELFQ